MRPVGLKRNLIDRLVEYVDPVRARQRLRARGQLALAGQWIGARKDRRATKDWNPFGGSADEDNRDDLPDLRNRSRDLQRRNPIALGAINTKVISVVGTGLALRARPDTKALGLTAEAAQVWREGTEREFRLWAENPRECDAASTQNFYGIQGTAYRSARESGDVFATLPMDLRRACAYGLKVNLIEADRVSNKDYVQDTPTLVGGVQKTEMGEPVAYHIARQHPGDVRTFRVRDWDVVPAYGSRTGRRNVVHLYEKLRPGQTRGVPDLAPVIEMLKQISDYTHAELQAAVVASMFTVFVETEAGTGLDLGEDGGSVTSTQKSGSDIKLDAGAIIDLAKGEKIEIANPGRPNSAADVFLTAMLRQVGVALQLPYEVLVKHFTSSYSAARAALLEAWRYFKSQREWFAAMFCQPIYEAWLDEAVARGRVIAPGYFDDPVLRMAWAGSEWIGDGPGQIDPLKEVQAAATRIEKGLSNYTIETMGILGMDWLEVDEQLGRELQQRKVSGTQAEPPPAAVPADPKAEPPAKQEEQDEDEE